MAKRKNKGKEEKDEEDLLFWAANLSHVIIYGKLFNRIRYDGGKGKNCPGCHKSKGALHDLCCPEESCAFCEKPSLSCLCSPNLEDLEIDHPHKIHDSPWRKDDSN